MLAENVMSAHVLMVKLETDATVRDVINMLDVSKLHELPVVDDKSRPVGLISAREILHMALPAYVSESLLGLMKAGPDVESIYRNLEDILDHPIRDVVSRDFETVRVDTPTSAVAGVLINLQGDHKDVLVVDHQDKLVGIISARDIICRQHL